MFFCVILFLVALAAYVQLANQNLVRALQKEQSPWQFSKWAHLLDLAIILALWLPYELGIVKSLIPPKEPVSFYVAIYKLCALVFALHWFLIVRQFPMDFRLVAKKTDWGIAIRHFLILAPILAAIAIATDFVTFSGFPKINLWNLMAAFFTSVMVLYAIAIPEELLFRGMLQRIMERWFGKNLGLIVAAAVFGLAHGNSGDLRYMGLATIAGYGYGLVYQKTKSIFPAALLHAGVDIVWVLFFYTATPKG